MIGESGIVNHSTYAKFVRGTWLLSHFLPVLSFFRSNKQQEKEKKFQRIQTEHIKSEC